MRRVPPLFFLAWMLAPRALPQTCAPVEHDPITARDLAGMVPEFGRLAAATPIGPAPGAGVRRVFRSLELTALARNLGLDLASAPPDLCFEWPMETLDRNQVREAMLAALPFPDTKIDILETNLNPAPRGRIEFRREDLGTPALPDSPAPVVWRGSVVYGANPRFAVWARVHVTARVPKLVAVEPIARGTLISRAQIRLETGTGFPGPGDAPSLLDQVAGRVALRNIAAGSEIRLSQIELPPDVKRGDAVSVEVLSGTARLAFTGKSESDGRTGDTITIRNPHSNRVFLARVDGKDKALVDMRGPADLEASRRN